jgi:hypothetical protein
VVEFHRKENYELTFNVSQLSYSDRFYLAIASSSACGEILIRKLHL